MKGLKHGIFILSAIFLLCTFVPLQAGATAPYITEGDFLYAENDDGTLSVFRYNGDLFPPLYRGVPLQVFQPTRFFFMQRCAKLLCRKASPVSV